jgi:uncharacterized protein YecE (DUF72 family)
MQGVFIGTSGWSYKGWDKTFYPKGWPKSNQLGYYVQHFPTVEINATFYRLPTESMVRGWHDKAPQGFVFALKGSRFITHIKRLKDTGPGLKKYFDRVNPLGDFIGPILWQLPPNFQCDLARLEEFLSLLPHEHLHAVEFRHPSWMNDDTFDLLRRGKAASVWLSSLRMPRDFTRTGAFVYLRFHGLEGGAAHDYTTGELRPWANRLKAAAREGIPCYAYFNNDINTRAPENAKLLMQMAGDCAVPVMAATREEAHAGRTKNS